MEIMAQMGVTALTCFPTPTGSRRPPRKAHKSQEAMPSAFHSHASSPGLQHSSQSLTVLPRCHAFCYFLLPGMPASLHLIPISSSKLHPMSPPLSSFPQNTYHTALQCSFPFLRDRTSLYILYAQHRAWDIEDDMNE